MGFVEFVDVVSVRLVTDRLEVQAGGVAPVHRIGENVGEAGLQIIVAHLITVEDVFGTGGTLEVGHNGTSVAVAIILRSCGS